MDKICAAIERVADRRHGRLCVLGEAVAAERICDWLAVVYASERVYKVKSRRDFVRALYDGYATMLGAGPTPAEK